MVKRSEYIVVDSISSVDPNALSVDQLNQKFIDKQGNRFALRFNRNTKERSLLESHWNRPQKERLRFTIINLLPLRFRQSKLLDLYLRA